MARERLLLMLMLAGTLWRCAGVPSAAVSLADWTVMVYMAGDNNLDEYVVRDLDSELATAAGLGPSVAKLHASSGGRVEIVALADRALSTTSNASHWDSTKLFHVQPGMQTGDGSAALADWGERNMGDPATLVEFVSWTRQHLPARRYALFFWGHGWNWHSGHVMQDNSSNDALEMSELAAVLPQLGVIDFVGFDACNMASLEVTSMWFGHAHAMAYSQEYVDWEGVQYDQVLERLRMDSGMSAEQLAVLVARTASEDRTWSAVVLDRRFQDLLLKLERWSEELMRCLPDHRPAYDAAFNATQSFVEAEDDRDLLDMAKHIYLHVPDQVLQAACLEVMRAVESAVVYERHLPDYANAHGISICQAAIANSTLSAYHSATLPSKLSHWNDFLDAYNDRV